VCEEVAHGGEVGSDLGLVVVEFMSPADAGDVDGVAGLVAAGIEDCELCRGGWGVAEDSGY
jgi:hypothetical protein